MTDIAHAPAMTPAPDPDQGKAVFERDRAHVFHSWSAQDQIAPLPIAGAAGSRFWDYDGNSYLDFASQLVFTNIGHQHPKVVAAIQEQAAKLCTISPTFANDKRAEAAELIASHAPDGLDRVFFTNAGADAIENAVRMARVHTGRPKILTAYRSYHGNSATAITMTGDPRRWANESAGHHDGNVAHFFGPYLYRSHFYAANEAEESQRALAHLEQTIMFEGPATIAAVILESVVGTNGILIPPPGYLAGVRALCDRYGIVYIADEVMAGFGRTGAWFAVDHWNVTPDLITFAKGVNSGYIPLGGVIISEPIHDTFRQKAFPGGLTYSGHPLACAAAVATIKAMREEGMVEHAKWLGENVLGPTLREFADRHPSVGEARGIGAFWALDLVRDKQTREPLVPYAAAGPEAAPMAAVLAEAKKHGTWPFTHFNRLQITPPLNLTEDEAREGLAAIDKALDVADTYVGVSTNA
ncbi:MAG: aspartate aminotransferase family protein [Actinocrinis sp.]